MPTYTDILRQYNFTNLPDNDSGDNLVYPKTPDQNGMYTINYESPATASILLSTGYYTNTDQEYLHFRALTALQDSAVEIVTHNDVGYDYSYSVFFSDVANINFVDSAIDNASTTLYFQNRKYAV